MVRTLASATALVALLLAAAPAGAGTLVLVTPPLLTDNNVTYVRCNIANVGATPLDVTIQVLDHTGAVTSQVAVALDPGEVERNVLSFNGTTLCKFIIPTPKNKKKKPAVRANACVSNFASSTCQAQADAR